MRGIVGLLAVVMVASATEEPSWSCFRGPNAGLSPWTDAPLSWDGPQGRGILWKTPLSKAGVSSPVLWGRRLYLSEGDETERAVCAFDAESGILLWRRVVADGGAGQPLPPVSEAGLALPTPVCDARGVVASFGTGDVAAFTPEGVLRWQVFLRRPSLGYGYASSPRLFGDLVGIQCDDVRDGQIVALDAATGVTRWRKERSRGAAWSSPLLIPAVGGGSWLVVNANGSLTAFDAAGTVVWDEDGVTGQVTPTPAWDGRSLYAVNGMAGMVCLGLPEGRPVPGWKTSRLVLTDTASPVAVGGLVFMATGRGRLDCLDASTGAVVWQEPGPGCHASLTASGDRVYALGRDGTMLVFAGERSFRTLATNPLGDASDATPAFAPGRIYLRGRQNLWAIGAPAAPAAAPAGHADPTGGIFGAKLLTPRSRLEAEGQSWRLTVTVPIQGGCCFPLTAKGLKASLALPTGVGVVTGPEPAVYEALEAPSKGANAVFRWHLNQVAATSSGTIAIRVTSTNSGSVEATCELAPPVPILIRRPDLGARLGPAPLPLAVEAVCCDENRYVESVRFLHVTEIPTGAQSVETSAAEAGRGLLAFTLQGQRILLTGRTIDLARKHEPTVWRGVLDLPSDRGLVGLAYACDDLGTIVCSPVVTLAGSTSPHQATQTPSTPWLRRICLVLSLVLSVTAGFRFWRQHRRSATLCGLLALACLIGAMVNRRLAGGDPPDAPDGSYPLVGSAVVCLFLDGQAAAHDLARMVERFRQAHPHRLHVVSVVEGLTPAPLAAELRRRLGVTALPAAVVDLSRVVVGADLAGLEDLLRAALDKPSPQLSMELKGGVIAGSELSVGFIMCNHAPRPDARGQVSLYVLEDGVTMGGSTWNQVLRHRLIDGRAYEIPQGKCQPPALSAWRLPAGASRIGALVVVVDEQGRFLDAICLDRPCLRAGVCG